MQLYVHVYLHIAHLCGHHQLMVDNVVWSEPHSIESTRWVQVTGHSIPAVDILSNTLRRKNRQYIEYEVTLLARPLNETISLYNNQGWWRWVILHAGTTWSKWGFSVDQLKGKQLLLTFRPDALSCLQGGLFTPVQGTRPNIIL